MLALSATHGDDCFRTDLSAMFHLEGSDPTILGDWQALQTIGEQIIERIVQQLTTTLTGIAGVWNQRIRPFEETELPAVTVKPGREIVTYPTAVKRTSPVANHELHVLIRIETAGDPPRTDPLRILVIRTLMGDRSLGGLAIGIGECEREWADEAGTDATYGVLTNDFEVQYATATNDATVQIGG
jgi:hypothetical protein